MFSQPFLVFLQVAESGSFSKAAARLLVTPASVMKHMNTLEGRLGLTLVRRSNQGIELTAAGQVLCQEGRKLFQAGETAWPKPVRRNGPGEFPFEWVPPSSIPAGY